MIEDAADWDVLLDDDVFAVSGEWRLAAGGPPVPVRGVYTAAHLAAAPGGWSGVSSASPMLAIAEVELPDGAEQDDSLTIEGRAWRVADMEPDGAGMVRVILEVV